MSATGSGALNPEDVSILFFERDGLDVQIHSLGIDKEGNVLNAPRQLPPILHGRNDQVFGVVVSVRDY